MPEQPTQNPQQPAQSTPPAPASLLHILQINLNKSEKAHLDLLSNIEGKDWDIVLIQEPHTTKFNAIRTPNNFCPIFPEN